MWHDRQVKIAHPFPSVSLSLPDDVLEDHDSRVSSYWKAGDSCLLQLSCFVRETGDQVSAQDRLAARMGASLNWSLFELPRRPADCEVAAAKTIDVEATTWVHAYLVWQWLTIYVTVSQKADLQHCDWAWDALASIRPVVM
jgi:hypothetical protein